MTVDLRGAREREPKVGDSEIAQYVLLTTFYVASVILVDPTRAADHMAILSAGLGSLPDEPDATMLAAAFEVARKIDTTQDIEAICARTEAGSAVGTVARLLKSVAPGRSSNDRAMDHLSIGPATTRRSALWGVGYERIVVHFFQSFWRHEATANAFRFSAPAAFRRELERISAVAVERRVQTVLKAATDALGLEVSPAFREWFNGERA